MLPLAGGRHYVCYLFAVVVFAVDVVVVHRSYYQLEEDICVYYMNVVVVVVDVDVVAVVIVSLATTS